jgi:hypothetical protein
VVPEALLVEALFFHLGWGTQQEIDRMRPRRAMLKRKKKVSFTQRVSWSDADGSNSDDE